MPTDVKVMKSILSCRESICAQSHKQFLSYLFRQKLSYTAKSALEVFPPICNTTVNPSKTEFLIFGLQHQLSKLNILTIHLPYNIIPSWTC